MARCIKAGVAKATASVACSPLAQGERAHFLVNLNPKTQENYGNEYVKRHQRRAQNHWRAVIGKPEAKAQWMPQEYGVQYWELSHERSFASAAGRTGDDT